MVGRQGVEMVAMDQGNIPSVHMGTMAGVQGYDRTGRTQVLA